MFNAIIGIDVSKKDLSITMILDNKNHYISILNDKAGFKEFSKWIKKYKVTKVKACMEATGIYGLSFANYLYENNHDVSIVNPVCINAFAKSKLSRNKTDKKDSSIIAEYANKYDLRIYTPKDPVMQELRDLYQCLQHLKSQKLQINNFLEKKEHMAKNVIKSYSTISNNLEKEIKNLEKKIDDLLNKNDNLKQDVENICSIPGVGKLTAISFLSETPDISNFKDARGLAAFAGLTPKHHTSGTSINNQSRISKIGSKSLRKSLYLPAIVAKKHNIAFKEFSNKMEKKGKKAKVIIVAIMRKLVHMIFGIIKHKKKFNPDLYLSS